MTKRIHLFISGRVQGVFYRASAVRIAQKYGLYGFVKNLRDGRVEICAEGETAAIEQLIQWCARGPKGAHVEHVETHWLETVPQNGKLESFEIC